MKLKYEFEIMDVGTRSVAVTVGEDADKMNKIIRCNETAAAILTMLQQDVTEEQIVTGLKQVYEADEQVLEEKVHAFLALLREQDLLA